MYLYVKAIHIVFIVTWFAGLFYIPRLFIYNVEANEKPEAERKVLQEQFRLMSRRLWLGITWPSAILTLIFGTWMGFLFGSLPQWLIIKLVFVALLYAYHFSLHKIYADQQKGIYKLSGQQLRIWNEVATILLIAIVFLVTVKSLLSLVWGTVGIIALIIILLIAIRVYKRVRGK